MLGTSEFIFSHCLAAEESFSEPSYVVVNETVKQFPATGGVLTSLKSTGSSGANSSFEGPRAMNLLQDTLKSGSKQAS